MNTYSYVSVSVHTIFFSYSSVLHVLGNGHTMLSMSCIQEFLSLIKLLFLFVIKLFPFRFSVTTASTNSN